MEIKFNNSCLDKRKRDILFFMNVLVFVFSATTFSFNVENSYSQEEVISVVISKDQLVTVDEVFKIIKEQTEYRFMYPNGLFKRTSKVQLRKGKIAVVKLLKQTLSSNNYNFELTKNNNIIIKKNTGSKKKNNKENLQDNEIRGIVLDETTEEILPYATVRLLNTKYYTITNEDGKFEFTFDDTLKIDSLEVRFLGYQKRKISISHFLTSQKVYLTPQISQIDEVFITKSKKNKKSKKKTYELFYSLIQKYRNKNNEVKGKAFLSLNSSARNVPIEHIEGFYNSTQSLAGGVESFSVKSGRFGQNKSFSYYSLDNTKILKNFQLFKKTEEQILPYYPGNLSFAGLKSKYKIAIEPCISCDKNDISVFFKPYKTNDRLFSGEIIFDKQKLEIKKIILEIDNPKTIGLSSLEEGHVFTPKRIKLDILFNPLDIDKIQHIDFVFDMQYTAPTFSELINCNTFLYFYDYNSEFEKPYFTDEIEFKNDYDKIVALQASQVFWKENYQFPKSYNDERYMRFMEEYGYIINYENAIPLDYIEYVKPSVIDWNNTKRLNWSAVKHGLVEKPKTDRNLKDNNKTVGLNSDKQSHFVSEMNKTSYKIVKEKMNFSYVIDFNIDKQNKKTLTSRTVFDRNSSYSKNQRTRNRLIYINLIFDIYEYYRRSLDTQAQFLDQMSYEDVKKIYDEKFDEASDMIKKMKKETGFGSNYQGLIKWNNNINYRLKIDNFKLIESVNN